MDTVSNATIGTHRVYTIDLVEGNIVPAVVSNADLGGVALLVTVEPAEDPEISTVRLDSRVGAWHPVLSGLVCFFWRSG